MLLCESCGSGSTGKDPGSIVPPIHPSGSISTQPLPHSQLTAIASRRRNAERVGAYPVLRLFWTRLSVRGYPASFLLDTFRSAPDYSQRAALLAKPDPRKDSTRSQVLILTFSRSLHQAQLGRILHEHRYLLPVELQELKVIVAWRAPKKLGAMLIPYRFNSPTDEDTPLACV